MCVKTKYEMSIDKAEFSAYLNLLKNKTYKLLPLKEEGLEWEKHLETISIEVSGLSKLIGAKPRLISLLSKLESLHSSEDFMTYRKTVFECLNEIEVLSE